MIDSVIHPGFELGYRSTACELHRTPDMMVILNVEVRMINMFTERRWVFRHTSEVSWKMGERSFSYEFLDR